MQEKPSNPVDPGSIPDGSVSDSSSGGPEDFLGLGDGYDTACELPGEEQALPEFSSTTDSLDEDLPAGEPESPLSTSSWLDEEVGEESPDEDNWDLGESEDDDDGATSWLMELDVEDEQLLTTPSETSSPVETQEEVTAGGGRRWPGLVLIALLSVGGGVAISRYLPDFGKPSAPPAPTIVADAPPPVVSEPSEVVPDPETPLVLGPVADTPRVEIPFRPDPPITGSETEVVELASPEGATPTGGLAPSGEPGTPGRAPLVRNPFRALTGPRSGNDGTLFTPFVLATRTGKDVSIASESAPTREVLTGEDSGPSPTVVASPVGDAVAVTEPGRESRTQVVRVEDMLILPEELGDRIREASASDLAGIWQGASIPFDAIEADSRLLTPSVGRVRVILGGGEIFEGQLYAVGGKKVWLDTELGKMALLSWQVHRIEHILDADGIVTLGEDGSQDLAGLERVRVRTPGGVFYGMVIDRSDEAITLITSEGARITLRDAVVEPAGKSLTRLVDATGALEEEPEEKPE
jgi:hypothetical protein